MGRLDAAKQFIIGLAEGVRYRTGVPLDDRSSAFRDGYAEGRRVAREAVAEYLASRGFAPLGDITMEQVLE